MNRKMQVWKAYAGELGIFSFWSYLWQRLVLRRKILRIAVSGLYEPVCIRNQPADHALFTQLFINKEYEVALDEPVKRIIDCGANIGLASLYFLRQYPAASITCIEPDPMNFFMLQLNTRSYKNIHCLQKAVWNEAVPLHIHGYSRGPAGLMVQQTDEKQEDTVEGIPLTEIIAENERIDILKIDIEGSEKEVLLTGETPWIKNVCSMFVELHEDIHPGITIAIKEKFSSEFDIKQNGEYHIFKNRTRA
jgi:FkbM family methyltransferase